MSQHTNTEAPFNLSARVPFIQWLSIVSVIVSVAFALSSRLTSSDHTALDVAKLQSDVAEMRKQMALRDDVLDMNKQLRELEIEVAKLSDRIDHK
jgi:TolA-binding protein